MGHCDLPTDAEIIARLTAERDEALSGASLRKAQEKFRIAAERNVVLERERDEARSQLNAAIDSATDAQMDAAYAKEQRDEWKGKAEEAQGLAVWAVNNAAEIVQIVDGPVLIKTGLDVGDGTDADIYRALLEGSKGGRDGE